EVFDDVRLVGTPPENIGKFGGETDNWVWPRHNPDFSMFRIYANKDNKPAPYDPSNKPYKPAHYFPISLKGYQKGDFTMVYGFPGRTQEYLPSIAVEQIVKEINPRRTALREKRLNIYEKDMALNDTIRLMYASRYAGIANAYKKWTGEMIGLQKYNAIEKKNSFEKSFMDLFKNNPEKLKENKTLFTEIENAYNDYSEKNRIIDYYYECLMGIDIFRYINSFSSLFAEYKLKSEGKENKLEEKLNAFSKSIPFKNYRKETDIKLCEVMLAAYFDEVEETKRVPYLNQLYKAHNGNIKSLTKDLYDKSVFVDEEKMREVLKNFENKAVMYQDDPFYKLYAEISKHYAALMPSYNAIRLKIEDLQKVYMAALKDNVKTKQFYPDANGTLRVAYGKVNNYTPKDGVEYNFYTTIDGMVEKHATGNPDYEVQDRLIELYNKKDFGQYLDKDGTLHVSFIASNHTTGGNSGSPVLNANGELIGTNYDRNWEGTMSDVMYDPNMCRNISLDVRFTLWVIDKYAGAGYLLNEMKLIK
ncbi:MAG: S46 family peptidase, partial [Bacteroidia bacterium]